MSAMHHALIIAGRFLAGIVGAIAFYFAFFLYEDEEGLWQNRLEMLWIVINDRARITNNTTAALFNRIGRLVIQWFDAVFGKNLLSLRAVSASLSLSVFGFSAGRPLLALFHYQSSSENESFLIWGKMAIFVFYFTFLLLSRLSVLQKRYARIPTIVIVVLLSLLVTLYLSSYESMSHTMSTQPMLLSLSFSSDYIAIVIMRKLFSSMSDEPSTAKITFTMVLLVLLSCLLIILPIALLFLMQQFDLLESDLAGDAELEMGMLNFTTSLLCFIPAILMLVLLLHKIMWPLLSRLLYPLASRRVITDKKILIPVGALALTFAFNLQHVGAREILKLLS
jgi:hypothetical protein